MDDVNSRTPSGQDEDRPVTRTGTVTVQTLASRTRIILVGEIDVNLAVDLAEAVTAAEVAGAPTDVDASAVTFMDSSGIALLARLATRTPERLRLISPPDVVTFLLDVTRIGEMVDVVEDADSEPEPPEVA